jgi:hypothetical protein
MRSVAFLHSSQAHVATFDALLEDTGVEIETFHSVRPEWLERARDEGIGLVLLAAIRGHLAELAKSADIVVCTCSTLGPVAESMGEANILRVDAPMMERAVAIGGQVLLVLCLDSTVESSRNLLERAFADAELDPTYRLLMVEDAWPSFEAGDIAEFTATISRWVGAALAAEPGISCVVLGQASMHAARSALIGGGVPVLSSPAIVVARIIEMLDITLRLR